MLLFEFVLSNQILWDNQILLDYQSPQFYLVIPRQGPRLTLKKVRRGNEVPKKRDFNFDG